MESFIGFNHVKRFRFSDGSLLKKQIHLQFKISMERDLSCLAAYKHLSWLGISSTCYWFLLILTSVWKAPYTPWSPMILWPLFAVVHFYLCEFLTFLRHSNWCLGHSQKVVIFLSSTEWSSSYIILFALESRQRVFKREIATKFIILAILPLLASAKSQELVDGRICFPFMGLYKWAVRL